MGVPIRLLWVCLSAPFSEWGFPFLHHFLQIYPKHPTFLFQNQCRTKCQHSSEPCGHEHNACIVSHPKGRVSFLTITSLQHFNEAYYSWDPWGLLFWPTYTFIATLRNLLTYCIYFFLPRFLLYTILFFFSQLSNVLLQNDLDKLRKWTTIALLQRLTPPPALPSVPKPTSFPASFTFSEA